VNWTLRLVAACVTTTFVGAGRTTLGRTVTAGELGTELPLAPLPTATTVTW
jgi:hypothetical protein